MNKKILLCVNSDFAKGNSIGFRFFHVAKKLKKQGNNVQVIARSNYSKDFLVITPWYTHYFSRLLNALRIYILPWFDHRNIDVLVFDLFVLKQLKKIDINTIDTFFFGEFAARSISYLKKQGKEVILDLPIGHSGYSKYLLEQKNIRVGIGVEKEVPAYLDKTLNLIDQVIVPSDFVKMTLTHSSVKNIKTSIVPFGVYLQPNSKNIIKDDHVHFIFVGNVNMRKGVDTLLKAWKQCQFTNATLHIYGRIYKELKNTIEDNKKDSIIFHGFASKEKIYKQANVLVFPTLLEGSAKVVYEAMSYSLPVITTNNAGSIIDDKKNGIIIPIANITKTAEAMMHYYTNHNNLIKDGELAKQKVSNYTWDKYAQSVVSILTK